MNPAVSRPYSLLIAEQIKQKSRVSVWSINRKFSCKSMAKELEAPRFQVGFRFMPSPVDVVESYLRPRVAHGIRAPSYLIQERDVYRHDPWDLIPEQAFRYSEEMYFFSPRHHAGGRSRRAKRAAGSGLWDGRGKDELIKKSGRVIGHKTQLTFKIVSAQGGSREKTDWLMHEFRLGDHDRFDDLVLCKIFKKRASQHADGGHHASEPSSSSYPPCLVPSPRPADVCYVDEMVNSEENGSSTAPQPLLMLDPQQQESVAADDEYDFLSDVDIGGLAAAWEELGDSAFAFDELCG